METNFISEDVDTDFYGYEISDNEGAENEKSSVNWEIEFEMRGYGIKDIMIMVRSVKLTWDHVRCTDEEDISEARELELTQDDGWKFEVQRFCTDSVFPDKVDVDWKKKQIEVHF